MAEITLSAVLAADAVPGLTRVFAQDKSVFAVAEAGLCAVLWRAGGSLIPGAARRQSAERLFKAQRILEAAQQAGPILGAAAGQHFPDETGARRFLALNADELQMALARFGRLRQQQVIVRWDPQGAMQRFQEQAGVAAALEALARERSSATSLLLQTAMAGCKSDMASAFRTYLQEACDDLLELPLEGPDMLLNVAVAIAPGGETAFEEAMRRIAATWAEGLKVQAIGPLPPISFAAVTIERVESDRLAQARRRLGVGEWASPEEIEQAFRRLMKTAHPDAGGDADRARALVEARDLLLRMASLRRIATPDDTARSGLARLQRDGAVQRAA